MKSLLQRKQKWPLSYWSSQDPGDQVKMGGVKLIRPWDLENVVYVCESEVAQLKCSSTVGL